jgi:hypothetical protein
MISSSLASPSVGPLDPGGPRQTTSSRKSIQETQARHQDRHKDVQRYEHRECFKAQQQQRQPTRVAEQLAFRAPGSGTSRIESKADDRLELGPDQPRTD